MIAIYAKTIARMSVLFLAANFVFWSELYLLDRYAKDIGIEHRFFSQSVILISIMAIFLCFQFLWRRPKLGTVVSSRGKGDLENPAILSLVITALTMFVIGILLYFFMPQIGNLDIPRFAIAAAVIAGIPGGVTILGWLDIRKSRSGDSRSGDST